MAFGVPGTEEPAQDMVVIIYLQHYTTLQTAMDIVVCRDSPSPSVARRQSSTWLTYRDVGATVFRGLSAVGYRTAK